MREQDCKIYANVLIPYLIYLIEENNIEDIILENSFLLNCNSDGRKYKDFMEYLQTKSVK